MKLISMFVRNVNYNRVCILLLMVFISSVNGVYIHGMVSDNTLVNPDADRVQRYFCKSDVATVLHPFFMTRKEYLKRYEYNWRTRLLMEFKRKRCYFLTLTYSDENLPIGSKEKQLERATEDLQKFWKRLRSKTEYHELGLNFKYYAVTENGEEMGRLHFHALVFADGDNVRVLNHRTARPLFRLIDETWKLGRTQIRVADEQKIKYVTKYIFKRCFDPLYHSWKSQGLGRVYLTEALIGYLRTHVQGYIHLGGKPRYLPRYIRNIVFDDDMLVQLNEEYFLNQPPNDERYTKGYYIKDDFGYLSPLYNYIGDRIIKMQDDNKLLNHLQKYGGRL